MEALEKAVIELESSKGEDGYTLMEHLTELLDRIMANQQEYPLEKIEELSYFIKLARLYAPKLLTDSEVKKATRVISPTQKWIEQFQKTITVCLLNKD